MSEVVQTSHESVDGSRTAPPGGRLLRDTVPPLLRTLCAGLIGGGVTGLLVGGVLGRVAMRLLAVTSPGYAQGGATDDGAVVGKITLLGSLSLAALMTVMGALGGLAYLWTRRVLPPSRGSRVALFTLLTTSVGGMLVIHGYSSFDFSVIEPEWLSVSLLLLLPLLYGLGTAALVETLDGPHGWTRRASLLAVLVAAIAASAAFPFVFLVGTAGFAVALALHRIAVLEDAWNSRAVTVLGRALFVVLVGFGLAGIVQDVVSIASGESVDWFSLF